MAVSSTLVQKCILPISMNMHLNDIYTRDISHMQSENAPTSNEFTENYSDFSNLKLPRDYSGVKLHYLMTPDYLDHRNSLKWRVLSKILNLNTLNVISPLPKDDLEFNFSKLARLVKSTQKKHKYTDHEDGMIDSKRIKIQEYNRKNTCDIQVNFNVEKLKLTEKQQAALDLVSRGSNVFLTGANRTGKSSILKVLLSTLDRKQVYVVTGSPEAAVEYGCLTFRQFSGIPMIPMSDASLIEFVSRSRSYQYWEECKLLLLDDISGICPDLIDRADIVARAILKKDKPLGGIQIVACGDFLFPSPDSPKISHYAFESHCWKQVFHQSSENNIIELKEPLGYENNQVFFNFLGSIRIGAYAQVQDEITKCIERLWPSAFSNTFQVGTRKNDHQLRSKVVESASPQTYLEHLILPTKLFIRQDGRQEIEQVNKDCLFSLNTLPYRMVCKDEGESHYLEILEEQCQAVEKLVLKVGAQVVLLVTLDEEPSIVKGSRGVVVDWMTTEEGRWPKVKFQDDRGEFVIKTIYQYTWPLQIGSIVCATRTQIPLRLAWVLNLNMCEGMRLDKIEMELSSPLGYGQVYKAFSRLKNMDSLKLTAFSASCLRACPRVLAYNDINTHRMPGSNRRNFVPSPMFNREKRNLSYHVVLTTPNKQEQANGERLMMKWLKPGNIATLIPSIQG